MIEQTTVNQDFQEAVKAGLSAEEKSLPSRFFYDANGDKLFQKIMKMPEYYLTHCEWEIFRNQKEAIAKAFSKGKESFKLIELGAGDGTKTYTLLEYFLEKGLSFKYVPVDISGDVLKTLENKLAAQLPQLEVMPLEKEYFDALDYVKVNGHRPKILFFLGGNIGNFTMQEAQHFLQQLREHLNEGDQLFIGFDLKKDPRLIKLAYDDPHGITRDFNLNLLERINRELGGHFDLKQFTHYPVYDPETGTAKSFLVSMQEQDVEIEALEQSFHFKRWELIHTEVSQKFDLQDIATLAESTGFSIEEHFFDEKQFFTNVLWKAI